LKANIKDVITLLDTKANQDDLTELSRYTKEHLDSLGGNQGWLGRWV
jgi:hypothetical protein